MKQKNEPDLCEFIPMTVEEMHARGWTEMDVVLVCGDAYVDHPSFCAAVIGRWLMDQGFRVGLIAQPDWKTPESLKVFGRPAVGFGVASGNMDSMVCLYTAGRRLRHDDMYAPGGKPGLRPPHATVVYTQLCRAAYPGIPVVIGGMEASMRRVAQYDYWQDKMRPSILVDSKADILVFGMGEIATAEAFRRIRDGRALDGIPGTARLLGAKAASVFDASECVELPTLEQIIADPKALMAETIQVEREMNPWNGKRLIQRYGDRLLVVERPQPPLTQEQFDHVCELPYAGRPHWSYAGKIPAYETVKDSIPAVRGCPGGCAFCGLVSHQGHHVVSRSEASILRQVERLKKQPFFHGTISDIGGAAGNIFGHGPHNPEICKKCRRVSCMFPEKCPNYHADEEPLLHLFETLKHTDGIRHVFINSGIRLDLALLQKRLSAEIVRNHVSGHVKVAPEHLHERVLRLMRKGKSDEFPRFKEFFDELNRKDGREQYLIPLFISNFPGCTEKEMKVVDDYLAEHHWSPQQVQDYIPLPMTMGAAMYCAGIDADGNPIEVNRGLAERRVQRNMLRRNRSGGADPFRKHQNDRSFDGGRNGGRDGGHAGQRERDGGHGDWKGPSDFKKPHKKR